MNRTLHAPIDSYTFIFKWKLRKNMVSKLLSITDMDSATSATSSSLYALSFLLSVNPRGLTKPNFELGTQLDFPAPCNGQCEITSNSSMTAGQFYRDLAKVKDSACLLTKPSLHLINNLLSTVPFPFICR